MKSDGGKEFDTRCKQCSQGTQAVIEFLQAVATHAGSHVEPPTFDAKGEGITYWHRGRRFCRFDPKPQADHVWVLIPSGDPGALAAAGSISDRDDGPWVAIKNMQGAVRLVPEILRAYDAAGRER